jgi:lipoprotein-anchoring transpeptidase ErfK/SrfK
MFRFPLRGRIAFARLAEHRARSNEFHVMKTTLILTLLSAGTILTATEAPARDRYRERPPVVVSPDLSAPWVLQLGRQPGAGRTKRQGQSVFGIAVQGSPIAQPGRIRTAALQAPSKRELRREINPIYLPQQVAFDGPQKAGTIVIDTHKNFLYLVQPDGTARRYGVGTGKPGFEWAGTHKVSRKAVWPTWTPPAAMKVRERAKGRYIPDFMEGGPENPMGARALYLGSTEYRIHGTNQPWTIGGSVSSGCIRMRNEDVVDLYERVDVGATVVVM